MNRFVIDNSVVLSWCLEDEGCRYACVLLEQIPQCEALVPAIWPLELTNALLMAERRNRITEAELTRSLSILKDFPIQVEQEPPERAWTEILSLARSQGLTTYDASYLDLAMRTGLPIATLDKALKKAARKVQVPIYKP